MSSYSIMSCQSPRFGEETHKKTNTAKNVYFWKKKLIYLFSTEIESTIVIVTGTDALLGVAEVLGIVMGPTRI